MALVSKELKDKVYNYLVSTSDSDGNVKCSQIEIADNIGCGHCAVSNAMSILRNDGLLILHQGFGRTPNKYRVVKDSKVSLCGKESISTIEADCYICEHASNKTRCGQCINKKNFEPHVMLSKSYAKIKELESRSESNDKYGINKIIDNAVAEILKVVEEQNKELQELKDANEKYRKLREAVLRGAV